MKQAYFIFFYLLIISYSCKKSNNTVIYHSNNHKTNYFYWIKEKICFENDTNCLDSMLLIKDSISESITFENIDSYIPDSIIVIERTKILKPINNYNDKSSIIYRILEILNLLNNTKQSINRKIISSDYFKKKEIQTKYFFKINDKYLSISDNITLDYKYDNLHIKNINLLAKLDLKITGNDNLNKLKIIYKKLKFEDHVIHQYESVNKYCKNIYFKLQLITYDPMYFERDDYVPYYGKLRFYKFSDER